MKKTVFLISIMGLLRATCLQAQELIPYRKGDKWGFCTPDEYIRVIVPSKAKFILFVYSFFPFVLFPSFGALRSFEAFCSKF